ncbi:MAG: nucleoside monophosphate kinase, partial [Varibaculum cambriense]|nr:nucleoside monophosphate kinase [Varibaculum cambriense]
FLDQVLKDMGTQLDAVINLDVNLEDVVGRLLKRAEIEHRSDDTEPVIRRRLQVYQEQTEPLVRYYREAGLLINIDGNGSIDQVWENIAAQLQ